MAETYRDELRARFGLDVELGLDLGDEAPDHPWLHQLLLRRTQRRYADRPGKVFPVAGLCLGYPAQAGFISMRLPLDATVHIDRYDESGLAAAVDGYDRRRDARHSIGDRQRAPERFGTAEFYGWSEDKARQAMTPEGVGFAAWLLAHGFTFNDAA